MDIIEEYMDVQTSPRYKSMNFKLLYHGKDAAEDGKNGVLRVINRGHIMIDFYLMIFMRYVFLSKEFTLLSEIRSDLDLWLWRDFKEEPTVQTFWTENHMIAYLSTALLLIEKNDYYTNLLLLGYQDRLMKCLDAWFDTRIECGFTEYYSPVYMPYTLEGLLNIIDFSEHKSFVDKASILATRILDWMAVGFPEDASTHVAQPRGYVRFIEEPDKRNICDAVRVLMGDPPINKNSRLLCNLLTSDFFLQYLLQHIPEIRTEAVLKTFHVPFDKFLTVLNRHELPLEDHVMFLWGNGMFFNTHNTLSTAQIGRAHV